VFKGAGGTGCSGQSFAATLSETARRNLAPSLRLSRELTYEQERNY